LSVSELFRNFVAVKFKNMMKIRNNLIERTCLCVMAALAIISFVSCGDNDDNDDNDNSNSGTTSIVGWYIRGELETTDRLVMYEDGSGSFGPSIMHIIDDKNIDSSF
jgi:hypothetical protein